MAESMNNKILGVQSLIIVLKWVNRQARRLTFNSKNYWERRYKGGGTSGAGSYDHLAKFKAEFLNDFVTENDVKEVVEFGFGDGNQLLLANYPKYIGFDVS